MLGQTAFPRAARGGRCEIVEWFAGWCKAWLSVARQSWSALVKMGGELSKADSPTRAGQAQPAHWPIGRRFFRITTSPLRSPNLQLTAVTPLDHREPPPNTRNHVCAVPRPLHCQAPVAPALGQAARQLVRQRRRLQTARIEVCSPWDGIESLHPLQEERWGATWIRNGCADDICRTEPMTCSPRRTTLCRPP